MPFEPNFEDVYLTQRKNNLFDRIKVECKTEVNSDGVSRILNVWAKPTVLASEVQTGGVSYQGVVTFFVCYEDQDGLVKKCECGSEFKGTISADVLGDGAKVNLSVLVEKTESNLSGTRLQVGANLLAEAFVTQTKVVKTLSNADDLVINGKELTLIKSLGVRESVYPMEEEFEISCPISEVLCQRADAVVTGVQCGVGCIIVDGNVHMSAIFLQSEDKKDIIRENKTFPFRVEIDCEEAMPTMEALARVSEKSFKTDISVDENRGVSLINCSITLCFEGEAFVSENSSVVFDAFSRTHNVALTSKKEYYNSFGKMRSHTVTVSGRAQTDELSVGVTLLSCCGERVELASYECSTQGLNVLGTLYMTAFLKDADGRVFTRKLETPFNCVLEADANTECKYEVNCVSTLGRVKMVSATEFEIESQLIFTVYPWEECYTELISGVELLDEKPICDCALSVYIPTASEDLWSLAKRLNVTPENLIDTNPELQFPLTGKERIVVFRKK